MPPDDDLRTAVEAAVSQVENTPEPTPAPAEPPATPAPTPTEEPQEVSPSPPPVEEPGVAPEAKKATPPPMPPAPKPESADVAPKAWKATVASKWAQLDPEVRAEIHRRERDVTKAFGENSQVREFHRQFTETIAPYQARMVAHGSPLQVIHNLLQADYLLSSAPPVQRARFMATMIKDYGVDIKELDSALAGEQPTDPMAARLEQLLEQRLTPLQNFLNQQQQYSQAQAQKTQAEAQSNIEAMAADNVTYPHFEEVREDMADIIELGAKRGNFLTPAQAYERAVAMNPAWAGERVQAQVNAAQKQQALATNAKAQRALNASSSVRSQPTTTPVNGTSTDDLRSALEMAFNTVTGR